jgi:DNA-binding response OmpR family regulator
MTRLSVLCIEDEQELLEDMPRLLATYGIDVIATADYDTALRLSQTQAFDCATLDIKMPPADDMSDEETDSGRLTGVVVCTRLHKADPGLPIIVVTSVGSEEDHKRVTDAGATCVLRKPCYTDQIVQKIRTCARRK